jgi:hypothetical protein
MTDTLQAAAAVDDSKPTKKTTKASTDVVTLSSICKELKVEPTIARAKLRKAFAKHKRGSSWEWKKGDAAIKEVKALLKDKD